MKCWKCGGHMTKYGRSAICDDCGRSVNRSTHTNANSSDSDYSFSDALGMLGVAGLVSYAAKKLDSSDTNDAYQHHIDKKRSSFSIGFKRFARNTLYSSIAYLVIFAGLLLAYFCLDSSFGKVMPFYLAILSGLILIWAGCLILAIKGRDGYTVKNIIGSVMVNTTCKIAGMFVVFANIDFLNSISFVIRVIIGVCLLVASHYVYKEIRDS